MKRVLLGALIVASLFAVPLLAFASQPEQMVVVAADEIIDGNFIKFGSVIDIAGAVNGDVIVAGNSITISGPVAGDVIAAGSSITISGSVGGSVRVLGQSISITSEVARNVWALGSSVALSDESRVGWDLIAAGATITANGPVGGNITSGGATVVIGNTVGKNVSAAIDTDGHLILTEKANIAGNVSYQAAGPEQLEQRSGAQIAGEVTQQPFSRPDANQFKKAFSAAGLFFKMVSLFSLLVIGLIIVSLIPKKVQQVTDTMLTKPWPTLGIGAAYFFVTPLAIILLFFTIIGIPLALMAIPLYLISLYVGKLFVAITVGWWLMQRFSQGKYKGSPIVPLILGLIALIIVTWLPVLGWLIGLVAVWWALGGLFLVKINTIKEWR